MKTRMKQDTTDKAPTKIRFFRNFRETWGKVQRRLRPVDREAGPGRGERYAHEDADTARTRRTRQDKTTSLIVIRAVPVVSCSTLDDASLRLDMHRPHLLHPFFRFFGNFREASHGSRRDSQAEYYAHEDADNAGHNGQSTDKKGSSG